MYMKKIKKLQKEILKKIRPEKLTEIILVSTLLIVTIFTRFNNLGYSDYIGDEHKAFIELTGDQTVGDFFMSRRKGPMQFIVSHIPYLITGDFTNELAQRIPFSIISVGAISVFYLLIKRLLKNYKVAFLASFLLTVNGFIVGFGRIAQYQNLNLLLSFLALYFYVSLFEEKDFKKLRNSSLIGTFFWSLSILSHWDAIFIIPVVVIIFVKFLKNSNVKKDSKIKLVLYNITFGCLLLLPFLIPYTKYQLGSPENVQYFERRIEFGHVNYERYRLMIDLYNPYITFYLLSVLGFLGMLFVKKSYVFSAWFLFSYLMFEFFVRKPGTHIYNFIIPLTVLSAIAISTIYRTLPRYINKIWAGLVVVMLAFLSYQTKYMFIDHLEEYPWEQKLFYDFTEFEDKRYSKKKVKTRDRIYHQIITPKYTLEQKLPLFGFPHKRYWSEINNFINEQNKINQEELTYTTNEVKTISEWYMDADYGNERPFYIVGIKKPLSFVNDYKFPQIGGKRVVHEVKNEYGETVVRIYRVEER